MVLAWAYLVLPRVVRVVPVGSHLVWGMGGVVYEVGVGGEDSPPSEGVAIWVGNGMAARSCPHLGGGLSIGGGHLVVADAGGAEGCGAGGADTRVGGGAAGGRHMISTAQPLGL